MRAWAVWLGAIVGALVLCQSTAASALTALEQTKQTLEATRVIVDDAQAHDGKLKALSELLKTFLDTDVMARGALDKNWDKFSAAQQKEFLGLFRELFQRTYVQKLLLFDKPDFGYVGEEKQGDTTRVDTKIITPRDEFAVTYTMRLTGNRWMATDIKIEDLSLTTNFRRQLDRLLSKSGVEDLLNRMRKKYGPGGKDEDEL